MQVAAKLFGIRALGFPVSSIPNHPTLFWPSREQDEALASGPASPLVPKEGPAGAAHLLLETENLDGLKWALENHPEQPKLILIDPPYNTDKRFFYRDRQGKAARTKEERRAARRPGLLPCARVAGNRVLHHPGAAASRGNGHRSPAAGVGLINAASSVPGKK